MPKTRSAARTMDQFYTSRSAALQSVGQLRACLERVGLDASSCRWLEPSAGDGAFLDAMPLQSLGLDLDPRRVDIQQANFLAWTPPPGAPWIVVGNPPFGKNSSLAVQFFNHAAKFAEIIAMIVPRTFEKVTLQNRLSLDFELVEQWAVDPLSFLFEGQPVAVPCGFQIWRRMPAGGSRLRKVIVRTHQDFELTTRAQADFAFQRVGAAAGRIKSLDAPHLAPPSHHFIRVVDRNCVAQVRARFEGLDFKAAKARTAGNPSIGLGEIVEAYSAAQT